MLGLIVIPDRPLMIVQRVRVTAQVRTRASAGMLRVCSDLSRGIHVRKGMGDVEIELSRCTAPTREPSWLSACMLHVLAILATLVLALSQPAQARAPEGKAVAVVYDDSGSMNSPSRRWVMANYALQALVSTLGESDTLIIVWMNVESPSVYKGASEFDNAIKDLSRQPAPRNGGTPFSSVLRAIQQLEIHGAPEKWLLIVTDGEFTESGQGDFDQRALERAVAAEVRTGFVLLELETNDIATKWQNAVGAEIFVASNPESVISAVGRAAAWLNNIPVSGTGLDVESQGNIVHVRSQFPMYRVLALRQDAASVELRRIQTASTRVDKLREHRFTPRERLRGLPERGSVLHIANPDFSPLLPDAARQVAELEFAAPLNIRKTSFLPVVAASLSLEVLDLSGQPLEVEQGNRVSCDDKVQVVAKIVDHLGQSLTALRSDIASFRVRLRTGKGEPLDYSEPVDAFSRIVKLGTLGGETILTATAEYPGYFHFTSAPLRIRQQECQRSITLEVTAGLNSSGRWQHPVDSLSEARFVQLAVKVDGQPASLTELERWKVELGEHESAMETRIEHGQVLIRPKPCNCLFWWLQPEAGTYDIPFTLRTGRARDEIETRVLSMELQPLEGWGRRLRWYGCPFAALAGLALLLWYLHRLATKHRFGPGSRFLCEETPKGGGTIQPQTIILRDQGRLFWRWLWPSKAERMVAFGILFRASAGGELVADGRTLGKQHRIPGWRFDPQRRNDQVQDDATVGDRTRVTIDRPATDFKATYRN